MEEAPGVMSQRVSDQAGNRAVPDYVDHSFINLSHQTHQLPTLSCHSRRHIPASSLGAQILFDDGDRYEWR
jgi:hypothetical protein